MLLEHIKDQATQISQEVIKEENKKEHQVTRRVLATQIQSGRKVE